jgi:hypothetical protein
MFKEPAFINILYAETPGNRVGLHCVYAIGGFRND